MNKIKQIIEKQASQGFKLATNSLFFSKIGISRRRWAQIINGDKDPTTGELRRIAKFFGVSVTELITELISE
jgi:transcriptional regulator with XRE-family HTH domain